MRISIIVWVVCALSIAVPRASAQPANPTPEPNGCGMPLSGTIVADVTYTLTKDCTLTDTILVSGGSSNTDVELTINGGMNTIKFSNTDSSKPLFRPQVGTNWSTTVNLNNLSIDLEDQPRIQAIVVNGSLNLSNVTLAGLKGYAGAGSTAFILVQGSSSNKASINFSNVLAADNSSAGYSHLVDGNILNLQQADATLKDVVIRNNYWASAAISVGSGSSLTSTGCLTFSGVIPRNVKGSWTDSRTGACSGKIGNDGDAQLAAPTRLGCGFHSTTNFDQDASYNLRGDCVIAGNYNLTQGVTVRINGYGHRITSDATHPATFRIANDATLILDNFTSENVTYINFGTLTGTRIHAKDLSRVTVIENQGQADFSNSIFSDNVGSLSAVVAYAGHHYNNGATSFTNVIFRNNRSTSTRAGGGAAIRQIAAPASISLNGCITFDNNSPNDTLGTITDNSTGACDDTDTLGPGPPTVPPRSEPPGESDSSGRSTGEICDGKPSAVPLGSVACIFRHDGRLEVYGIDKRSRGFFMVAATPAQNNAACAGMIARSPTGRAAIFAAGNGDVTVSVGPDSEGKIAHVTLRGSIFGEAIAGFTTYGPPPGLAGPIGPQTCARTLQNCMVRTNNIVNFRDAPNGSLLNFVDIRGIRNDGMLPYDVTLTALELTDGWFKVDYHGERGWISAAHVTPVGSCD